MKRYSISLKKAKNMQTNHSAHKHDNLEEHHHHHDEDDCCGHNHHEEHHHEHHHHDDDEPGDVQLDGYAPDTPDQNMCIHAISSI